MIKFIIDYPATKREKSRWNKMYGLNAIYAGKHWAKRKKDSEFWHELVIYELRKQGIPWNIPKNGVTITMFWNDDMDIDNHAYMGKMIVDSLKGHLIADDTKHYFKSITHKFHDKNYILVKIEEAKNE